MKTAARMSVVAFLTVFGAGVLATPLFAASNDVPPDPVVIGDDMDGANPATGSVPTSAAGAERINPVQSSTPVPSAATSSSQTGSSVKEVLDSIKPPSTKAIVEGGVAPKDSVKPAAHAVAKDGKQMLPAPPKKESASDDEEEGAGAFPSVPETIPASVKGVVKRLNSATEGVTLDDLNSAREAMAKLDVLIDIEKRLSDLAEIRKEREEKVSLLEGAIPESALGSGAAGGMPLSPPPVAGTPPVVTAPPVALPPVIQAVDVEVVRIVGANGNYIAQVKEADGAVKQVRVGDKLGSGASISAISRSGVTLVTSDHKTKTFQIKDMPNLQNGRPSGI